jgi:hypothetical protein
MSSKKYSNPKLFEFRIKYNSGADHSATDSYHYYTAENAKDAFKYHSLMMEKHNFKSQAVSVERKDPYRSIAGVPPKWIDESFVINED